jgi:hypothetical protein
MAIAAVDRTPPRVRPPLARAADHLRRPNTDIELARVGAALGVTLPGVLRTWYGLVGRRLRPVMLGDAEATERARALTRR